MSMRRLRIRKANPSALATIRRRTFGTLAVALAMMSPRLTPLSNHPGSAQDLTWKVVLPTDNTSAVDAVGPTFWIGGAVTDPNSRYGQAFLGLQFYPNSFVNNCAAGGGFNVSYAPGVYTVCSPVWEVSKTGNSESAAFNAMLTDSVSGGALVMHAGDLIADHQYITPAADGMHITVSDLATGRSGTIVLNSQVDGPLMPAFDTQQLGNSLGWGLVHDAPIALYGRSAIPVPSPPLGAILPPGKRYQAALLLL